MKRWFKWLFLLLTVLLCIGGGLFLWQSGFFAAAGSQESLRAYIEDFSPYSHLCFFLIQFLSVILAPIPSNISALAGGVLFGTWVSFLLTFSAVTAGSLLVFSLARGLGRDAVTRLVGRKVSEKYLDVIHAKTDIFLVLAFLFPFFPDDVLCILAGLTQISFRRFAGIILCTRPWGLLFASALGGASFSIPAWGMALIGAAGLLLFLLGMKYGDRAEAAILRRLRRKAGRPCVRFYVCCSRLCWRCRRCRAARCRKTRMLTMASSMSSRRSLRPMTLRGRSAGMM